MHRFINFRTIEQIHRTFINFRKDAALDRWKLLSPSIKYNVPLILTYMLFKFGNQIPPPDGAAMTWYKYLVIFGECKTGAEQVFVWREFQTGGSNNILGGRGGGLTIGQPPHPKARLVHMRGDRGAGLAQWVARSTVRRCVVVFRVPLAELNISASTPVPHDWVIKGLGIFSWVCTTGHIKDPVPLIEKRRGLSPGGRFPPSFIHPSNHHHLTDCSRPEDDLRCPLGVQHPLQLNLRGDRFYGLVDLRTCTFGKLILLVS